MPQFFAAKIGSGEVELLDAGAHRAVEYDDVIGQCIEVATIAKGARQASLSLYQQHADLSDSPQDQRHAEPFKAAALRVKFLDEYLREHINLAECVLQ